MRLADLRRLADDLARQLEASVVKKDTIERKFEKPKVVKTALIGNAAYKVLQKKLNMVNDHLNDKKTKRAATKSSNSNLNSTTNSTI